MITTALTKLLNIRVPVVLAPMAGVSGGKSYILFFYINVRFLPPSTFTNLIYVGHFTI